MTQLRLAGLDSNVPAVVPADRSADPSTGIDTAIETGRNRLLLAAALFLLGFGTIGWRLIDLTTTPRGVEPRTAPATQAAPAAIPSTRADIVDRHGMMVATSLVLPSLYANPHEVIDPADAVAKLMRALPGLDRDELMTRLTSDRSFVWVKRNLTPRQQFEINRLGIPGLYFQREERRVYPHGSLTAHVVGFSNIDSKGLAGVEQALDERLRRDPQPLELSIDLRLQHLLREEIQEQIGEFNAIGGCGVILDVHTGEIVAMVSLPDFDGNRPGASPAETRFNRNTLGVYEQGSTFKIFTMAMALDSGKANFNSVYDATHPIKVSRFTIRDDHAQARRLTVTEIFQYSSNIGAVKMALDVGIAGQRDFFDRLGFLKAPGVELPEVGAPLVPRPWRPINLMTIAFGHGMAVSPLTMASGVATMVNGGVLRQPTLMKRSPEQATGTRVISAKTSDQMRRLMRLVVEKGTGKKAAAPGYLVGGKTGTAEKTARGGYRRKALLSSFVGAFPMHDPRYVVVVSIDEPKGNKKSFGFATAGWVAAPVVGRIVQRMGPVVGITPVDESAPEIRRLVDLFPGQTPPRKEEKRLATF